MVGLVAEDELASVEELAVDAGDEGAGVGVDDVGRRVEPVAAHRQRRGDAVGRREGRVGLGAQDWLGKTDVSYLTMYSVIS